MYNLGMVMIGGSGFSRPSLFSGNIGDNFGLAGPSLGQDAQQLYTNAKAEVAQFDQLINRTQRLANKTVREQVASDYGLNDPSNKDKGMYMRNEVQKYVAQAESYTPVNYDLFRVSTRPAHFIGNLHNFNSDFRRAVEEAEVTYGILPEPQIIERVVNVPGASTTNWTIPLVVAGGGIAVAAVLGLFSGK